MFATKLTSLKLEIEDAHSKEKGIKRRRGWTADTSHNAIVICRLNYALI
jgi:hypothetical protein